MSGYKTAKEILNDIRMLQSTEEYQEVIQGVSNLLAEAHEAGGDDAHKKAALKLMDAHTALNNVSGR